jgi:HD-GYP domain-containing protein (c-di-GMP phosphodiesterase class II)
MLSLNGFVCFNTLAFAYEEAPQLMRQNTALLNLLSELLHTDASSQVEEWIRELATALHFPEIQTHTLVRAAYLKPLMERNGETLPQGFSVQALFSHDVSLIIDHSGDWWDGSKGDGGLSGNHIPIESRVLALTEAFVTELNVTGEVAAALANVRREAGTRFDPRLVAEFEHLASRDI